MSMPTKPSGRLPALDGLRGVAAMVVFIHHCMLVSPALAAPYFTADFIHRPEWATILTYTPLHLFWAGTEAVYIFFVLSGFVLALPAASGRSLMWRRYYPRRLVRLYVPIIAAVILAYGLLHVGARSPATWRSLWLNIHPVSVGLSAVVHDLIVIKGAGATNFVLWSLQWEILFSLLLPVFLLVLIRIKIPFGVLIAVLLGWFGISLALQRSATTPTAFFYSAMFASGVIMAKYRDVLMDLGGRFDRTNWVVRAGLGISAVILLVAYWPLVLCGSARTVGRFGSVLGACLVVWLFMATSAGRQVGTLPTVTWVGKRSFSLYLIHEPVVVTCAVLLGRRANPMSVFILALPASLLITSGFYRIVERPSLRLASRIGQLMAPARSEPVIPRPIETI